MSPAPAEWLDRFADYRAALAAHDRAQDCIDQLQSRLEACAGDEDRAALEAGLALAKRRAGRTGDRLAAATDAFTGGRPVLEAIWTAPEDI